MRMMTDLHSTNKVIFIVLANWNDSLQVERDIAPLEHYSDSEPIGLCFYYLNAAFSAEKQQYQFYSLWLEPNSGLNPRSTTIKATCSSLHHILYMTNLITHKICC